MRHRTTRLLFAALALCLAGLAVAAPEDGSRPRNVAVSPDGQTVIATSHGSNAVTVFINGTRDHVSVGAPSWGVCFLDDLRAVVTVPSLDKVILLERLGATNDFLPPVSIDGTDGSFLGLTEVIPGTTGDRVFLASRGKTTNALEPWTHSVIELDVETELVERTLITEREPRAMILSPSDSRLFVGTAQGALGGSGLTPDNSHTLPNTSFDGGSVLSYNLSSNSLDYRFAIGSPIRGMAIWFPGGAATQYRLFFTHVGEGAQSEAPDFGGRLIPNVISSILFNVANDAPQSRQDVVFRHSADLEPASGETTSANLPTVVPEKLAIRPVIGGSFDFELWVTHSGSGTVSKADLLNGDGAVNTSGSVNLLTLRDTEGDIYKVVTGRPGAVVTTDDATTTNVVAVFQKVANPVNIRVDDLGASGVFPFSSNPRGIAYDENADEILVVTQAGHQLVTIDGSTHSVSRDDLATSPVSISEAEQRFFTFGGGFDFRESEGVRLVNNLSCGTCHVDGHIDGKVRLTVRPADNRDGGGSDLSHPVAVPSIFDVGETEWIFFEGLITIADRTGAIDNNTSDVCNYCQTHDFFLNTIAFTNGAATPASPWAPNGTLSADAQIGRAWFDAMNCSRCHAESAPTFFRTNDTAVNVSSRTGPIGNTSRILSDPTQAFITTINAQKRVEERGSSLRNMTNVGSRDHESNLLINGVNTPALAGAWDNGPYLHDGRYQTLEDVLDHTWVDGEGLAAPIWTAATAPENLKNSEARAATATTLPITDHLEHQFKTHKHGDPGTGWETVSDYLTQNDKNALLEFLRSLSSELDPYENTVLTITNLSVQRGSAPWTAKISWNTSVSAICRLTVENLDASSVLDERLTAPSTSHSETVTLDAYADWKAAVSVSYGSQRVTDEVSWDNEPQVVISNFLKRPYGLCEVKLTWNTNVATECLVDWGVYPIGSPTVRETTPSGTSHTLILPVSPSVKYQSKIWAPYQGIASTKLWYRKLCISLKQETPLARSGIVSVSPNPFNPVTEIRYVIPIAGYTELKIFDLHGRLVRTLMSAESSAGEFVESWKGEDDAGRSVASGVYFLQLTSPESESRAKLVLIE